MDVRVSAARTSQRLCSTMISSPKSDVQWTAKAPAGTRSFPRSRARLQCQVDSHRSRRRMIASPRSLEADAGPPSTTSPPAPAQAKGNRRRTPPAGRTGPPGRGCGVANRKSEETVEGARRIFRREEPPADPVPEDVADLDGQQRRSD